MAKVKEKVGSPFDGSDPTTRLMVDLRNTIGTIHWAHANQLLEIIEWIAPTDRQFARARAKALKAINDEEAAVRASIKQLLDAHRAKGDGNGK